MAAKALPPPDVLRQLLSYDPETGKLTWLRRPTAMFVDGNTSADANARGWNGRYAGKEAFTAKLNGYRHGRICGQASSAHRLIWAFVTGRWPTCEIDHINGVRDDNRLCNLRAVSRIQNMRNMSKSVVNTSGVTGVTWNSRDSRWVAQIGGGGKQLQLGNYRLFDDAVAARQAAEIELGYHPNHGRAR